MPQRKLFDNKTLAALKQQPIYSQDGKGDDAVAYARIFNPYGRGVIYLTEYDGDDTFYGYWKDNDYADGGEYGYFSKKELENTKINVHGIPLPLERDSGFKPAKLGSIRHPARSLQQQGLNTVSASASTAAKSGTAK